MNLLDNRKLQEINAEKQKFIEIIKLKNHPGYMEVLSNIGKTLDSVTGDLLAETDPTKILALHAQWVFAHETFQYLSTVATIAEQTYVEAFGVSSENDILVNL